MDSHLYTNKAATLSLYKQYNILCTFKEIHLITYQTQRHRCNLSDMFLNTQHILSGIQEKTNKLLLYLLRHTSCKKCYVFEKGLILTNIQVATVGIDKILRSPIVFVNFKEKWYMLALWLETVEKAGVIYSSYELSLWTLCAVNPCPWPGYRQTHNQVFVGLGEGEQVASSRTKPSDFSSLTVKGYSCFSKVLPLKHISAPADVKRTRLLLTTMTFSRACLQSLHAHKQRLSGSSSISKNTRKFAHIIYTKVAKKQTAFRSRGYR